MKQFCAAKAASVTRDQKALGIIQPVGRLVDVQRHVAQPREIGDEHQEERGLFYVLLVGRKLRKTRFARLVLGSRRC